MFVIRVGGEAMFEKRKKNKYLNLLNNMNI